MLVALYLMMNRDMAGVCPTNNRVAGHKCRMRPSTFGRVLKELRSCGKLVLSTDGGHAWWVSGIYHSLGSGKYSPDQLRVVREQLRKWEHAQIFPSGWMEYVYDTYRTKYGIDINSKPSSESNLPLVRGE